MIYGGRAMTHPRRLTVRVKEMIPGKPYIFSFAATYSAHRAAKPAKPTINKWF